MRGRDLNRSEKDLITNLANERESLLGELELLAQRAGFFLTAKDAKDAKDCKSNDIFWQSFASFAVKKKILPRISARSRPAESTALGITNAAA